MSPVAPLISSSMIGTLAKPNGKERKMSQGKLLLASHPHDHRREPSVDQRVIAALDIHLIVGGFYSEVALQK